MNILKALSGSKWGADKATMLIMYKSLILSCIDYGCEVYGSACKTHKKKIDGVQSQCLRLCSGAIRATAIPALEVECGIMPLNLRRSSKQVECAVHYRYYDNHPTRKVFRDGGVVNPTFTFPFQPMQAKVSEVVSSLPFAHTDIKVANIPL